MKIQKIKIFAFMLAVMMVIASGCVSIRTKKSSGDKNDDAEDYSSLIEVLSAEGDVTVTLSDDETIDLTGVIIVGRKEIFLNDFSLKLTGQLSVSEKGIIDIQPGKGFIDGVIDLRDLRFDISQVPDSLSEELSIIEIRPGVTLNEPETVSGFKILEFPDTLTAIVYFPVVQSSGEVGEGEKDVGQNNTTEEAPQQHLPKINLVKYDGGYFSVMLPEGWQIRTMGQYTTFGFRAWDPQNPDYEIFFYGNLGPINKSEDAKNGWASYIGNMGVPNAELNYDAPVVSMDRASGVFYKFDELQAMSDKYGAGFSFPALSNLLPQMSIPIETAFGEATTGESMMFAGVSGSNGGACGGMFVASLWNTLPYYVGGVDMTPTAALHVVGVIAPVEDFLNVEAILTQSVFSLRFTEQYIQDGIAYSIAVGEAAMASNAELQAAFDRKNKAWSEYFRGNGSGSDIDIGKLNELNNLLDTIKDALG